MPAYHASVARARAQAVSKKLYEILQKRDLRSEMIMRVGDLKLMVTSACVAAPVVCIAATQPYIAV